MFLLLIGVTILATIVLSNNSLEQSKQSILSEGNLATFTVSIPEEIRQQSDSSSKNSKSSSLGDSLADKELQEKLEELKLQYNLSKSTNVTDILSGNNFIVTNGNFPNSIDTDPVNKLVLNEGSYVPNQIYNSNTIVDLRKSFSLYDLLWDINSIPGNQYWASLFSYESYLNYKPWIVAQMMLNSIWNLDDESTQDYIKIIEPLAKIPSREEYYKDYDLYYNGNANNVNKNSYWYQWRQYMYYKDVRYTGFGFDIDMVQTIPLLGPSAQIPFSLSIYDPTSYFAVASSNFMNANKSVKEAIPYKTLIQALQLPFKTNLHSDSSANPVVIHKVFNPLTGKEEPYPDFVTWVNSLDNRYKVIVNSQPYIIVGSGLSPDMMYPVVDANQPLINSKNSGVLYMNNAGFERANYGSSVSPTLYYSVKIDAYSEPNAFAQVQNYTIEKYGRNTVYYLDDASQPNYVIYLRANFLNNLQKMIFIITLIIGVIIGLLSLFFISTLLRSIIKQSKITFGVGLANGISKAELALSFFPLALIPAAFCGVIGYLVAYFLMMPMNGIYNNYWTVQIPHLNVEWWLFLVIPIIVFVILYVLNIFVVFWTLRHNTQSLLNSSAEFRMNWFIVSTKWITMKLSALSSFRWTFMMGNFTRFLILTFIVFCFSSLLSIVVGSLNEFKTALSYTNRNKEYNYSFDLYSPTIAGGYYSAMPYDQIGITQMGQYNNYSTWGVDDGNYMTPNDPKNTYAYSGAEYANALQYPYSANKYYTSLFMPSTKVATEMNNSIQFFNNKTFTKMDLDINLDIAGASINPWDIAKQIMPKSIISLADTFLQKSIQLNYDFYYWLQTQNDKNTKLEYEKTSKIGSKPILYTSYLPNVNEQPFTIDGSNLTNDINDLKEQSKWIFSRQKDPLTGEYYWRLNQDVAVNGAPTYMLKPKTAQLMVQILTNNKNPLFNYWYKHVYTNDPESSVPNYGYKIATGVVSLEPNDETYTYLKSQITQVNNLTLSHNSKETQPIEAKILGIKPNSKYVVLYDSNNQDLKPLLNQNFVSEDNEIIYPLIINQVVKKQYGLKQGDILKVSTSNTYDRYNLININENPDQVSLFKIVGITTSKSEEQFYTSQSIANNILGYQDFSTKQTPENWNGPFAPGRGYIPFNGYFSNQKIPESMINYGGLYSPSGLSTTKGAWNTQISESISGGEMGYLLRQTYQQVNAASRVNYMVDRNDNNKVVEIAKDKQNPFADPSITWYPGYGDVGKMIRHVVDVYGSTMPIVTQLQYVDSPLINDVMGTTIDSTFLNIEIVVIVSLIPTLLIIIILLALMIVVEARRLISLLKVLGYTDLSNAFSFMFVYVVVLFLGVLLSVPFTFGVLSLIQSIVFTTFKIIISPMAPVWIYFVAFEAVGSIFACLFLYVWMQMKKINLPQAIAIR